MVDDTSIRQLRVIAEVHGPHTTKARNQLARARRRATAGKPSYRQRQASSRAAKAKREHRPNYSLGYRLG